MSTKFTDYTQNLSLIPYPLYTILVLKYLKMFKGTSPKWIKIFSSSVLVNIQNYPIFSSFTTSVSITNNKRRSERKLGILSAVYTP